MPSNQALRRRVAPCVPLEISFEDSEGKFSRTFRVAFNLNVLADISERTDSYALDFFWTHMDARMLRAVLWAALLPNHPEYDTRDDKDHRTAAGMNVVGSWLHGENQDRAFQALWEAYLLYLPEKEAELYREAVKRKLAGPPGDASKREESGGELPLVESASDGSNSGRSAATTSESPKMKSAS